MYVWHFELPDEAAIMELPRYISFCNFKILIYYGN